MKKKKIKIEPGSIEEAFYEVYKAWQKSYEECLTKALVITLRKSTTDKNKCTSIR
jgi:hypothetical protein